MFKPNPLSVAIMLACTGVAPSLYAEEQVLAEVQVSAAADAPATNGYQPVFSRASTKTDTALLDTPQSVSVVTAQQIKDQAVQSMAEAVRYTPGITFAQGEGNRDAAVIRGSTSTGDFFLDGVRDDVQYYRDVYNIDRVEILKGSNGLAFGRGGAGGVINRVSKEAGWTPVREVNVSVGSYDHKRIALDVGGGLTSSVAGRVNVVSEDSDSYRDGVSVRRNGISPTLTLKPSDRTKVVLSAEYFNDLRVTDRGIPSQNGKPFKTDESTFFGNAEQSPTETTVRTVGMAIEHRFKNGVMLSNKTRYADYDKYYQNVYANGSVSGANMVALAAYHDDTQRQNVFNQTDLLVRATTGSIKHDLLLGTEFGRQDTENFRINGTVTPSSVSASNPRGVATFAATRARDSVSQVDVSAVYIQDQLTFNKQWQMVLGLRQDRFVTDFTDKVGTNSGKTTDTELSPRAALIYKPVDSVSIYTSYSKTFVPRAGDQLSSLTGANRNFDPESFLNKEVGVKWDPRADLSLAATLYRLERGNVAITDPAVTTQAILVDGQRVKGAELSATGKINHAWSVTGGYAFADSAITKSQTMSIKAGNETNQTPRHTFSLWNRYDVNDRYGVALGFVSRSRMFAQDDNTVKLPGYGRVDAAAFLNASKNLQLQLNIENLLNRDYYVNAHNNNNITPGSPIAARLSATYKF
ncbi:TonB-dependent receptor [Perlucidibaca aquatica]|uniref:TonB-dependent receptor n=1 Tax=Perlucidibaca aquatica TaxID=1852776 RepID=UPI000AED9468|nr:TonB-dependent siderophore receptor [Perlucidibaca aquatica]